MSVILYSSMLDSSSQNDMEIKKLCYDAWNKYLVQIFW